jgi:hypothetical protein
MDHYVTQAASKAKPNGGIVKAGSDSGCRTVAILSQGKESGIKSLGKATKIRQWREHDRLHRGMGA